MWKQLFAALTVVALLAGCESSSEDVPTTTAGGGPVTGAPGAGAGYGGGSDGGYSTHGSGGYGAGAQSGKLGPGAQRVEREIVAVGDTVYFAFDSYALDATSQATLDKQAVILMKNAGIQVTIEGHTDERGTREYNLALGERRATAVKDYLVASGVNPGRVRTISYGKERPVALGSSEEAWARNRRAVTVVTGGTAGS